MGATDQQINIIFQQNSHIEAEVSVIITLYNYANMVKETLDSLLHQELASFDLVIVEDCSTDNSLLIAEQWVKKHRKRFNGIKFLQHKENRGLGVARNTAFRCTETPFVFVLDADNILYPHALLKLLAGLKNTDAAFAFCYLEHFGDVNKLGGLQPWNPETLVLGNTIDAMVLMRKNMWEKTGGYSEDMPYNGWEDYELWFKFAKANGWGVRIPEILCRYRVHVGSMLNVETNKKVEELSSYLKKKHGEFWTSC